MALQKQTIDIPFGGGLREDIDDRILQPPYLDRADNASFAKQGSISKRRGVESMNATSLPTETSGVNAVFEHHGHPAMYSRRGVFVYSGARTRWAPGAVRNTAPLGIETWAQVHGQDPIANPSIATDGSLVVHAWEADSKVWYQVMDATNKAVLSPTKVANANIDARPTVVYVNGTCLLFGLESATTPATLRCSVMTVSGDSYTFGTAVSIQTSTAFYDVDAPSATSVCVVAALKGDTNCIVRSINNTAVTTNALTINIKGDSGVGVHWSVTVDSVYTAVLDDDSTNLDLKLHSLTDTAWASTVSATGVMTMLHYNDAGTTTTQDSITIPQNRVALHRISGSSQGLWVAFTGWFRDLVGGPTREGVYTNTRWAIVNPTAFTLDSAERDVAHTMLASRMFRDSSRIEPAVVLEHYIGTNADGSTGQPAQVLVTIDVTQVTANTQTGIDTSTVGAFPIVLSRFNPAASTRQNKQLAQVAGLTSTWLFTTNIVTDSLQAASRRPEFDVVYHAGRTVGPVQSITDTRIYEFDFSPGPVRVLEQNSSKLINAGLPFYFDGNTCAENGPLFDPEPYINIGGVASTSDLTSGRFMNVYLQTTDAHGNLHRSAPGHTYDANQTDRFVRWYTTSATARIDKVQFAWCNLSHHRERDQNYFKAVLGASEAGETVDGPYYRIGEMDFVSTTAGASMPIGIYEIDPQAVNFDIIADALVSFVSTIGSYPLFYSEAELAPVHPPPFLDIALGTSRYYGINAEDPSEVWASKIPGYRLAAEWHPSLTLPTNPNNKFTAIATMDEKVVLFTEDRVYLCRGTGPDNFGNGTFPEPELLSSDTGCTNKRTVVEGPFGVMFQGHAGFYLVTRGLSVEFIGGPIEDSLGTNTIHSATLVPADNEVRFTTQQDTVDEWYIFDYLAQQWRTQPGNCFHAAMVNDRFTYIKDTSLGYAAARERLASDTNFADVGEYTTGTQISNILDIETAWIKVTGLQDFKRIYKVLLLGEYRDLGIGGSPNQGGLRVRIAYNYDETWVDDRSFTGAYHDMTSGATAGDPFQLEVRPSRQKCQAMKVRITEVPSTNGSSVTYWREGVRISGLTLEYGRKRGVYRPSDRRA